MSLEVPGQIRLSLQLHPGPNVTPAAVNNQGPGMLEIHQFGGMTKLEYVAAKLVAAGLGSHCMPLPSELYGEDDVLPKGYGDLSRARIAQLVELAKMTLEACDAAQRQMSQPENPPKG